MLDDDEGTGLELTYFPSDAENARVAVSVDSWRRLSQRAYRHSGKSGCEAALR